MKKYKIHKLLMPALLTLLLLSGCGQKEDTTDIASSVSALSEAKGPVHSKPLNQDDELMKDYYKDYKETGGEVAIITTTASIGEGSFNEAIFMGAQTYAQAAGVSYSHYGASSETALEFRSAVTTAIEDGASLVICAGYDFAQIVGELQTEYPKVHFLLVDSLPTDDSGNEISISSNVHCITYKEEEAGYLAGYLTVMDGYTQFGFIGGMELPPVQRFGYGYLQGIDAAAAELAITDDVEVNYWYCDSFNPSEEIETTARDWYQNGTEVIFSCGGSIYESVLSAADQCDGLLIGVDTDQSAISKRFLTSASKGVKTSVILALDEYFANGNSWPESLSGQAVYYGAGEKCIELPTNKDAWRFQTVTVDDYQELFSSLKKGELSISSETSSPPALSIAVTYTK